MITNSVKNKQNTSIFSFPTKPRKLNVAKLRHSLSSIFSECPGFLKIKKRTSVLYCCMTVSEEVMLMSVKDFNDVIGSVFSYGHV